MRLRPALGALGLAAALAAGAGAASVAPGIRGTLALEPGRIRAGDVATLEIVVTTPPDHRVRPVVPPPALPGFWILDAESLPIEKEDGRWIHRTRVRLRARELGQYVWPAQPLEIETPDGATQRLVLDGRPLEVVSVQPEFPGRSLPFGLREPAGATSSPGSSARAAAAGALLGASAVGLIVLAGRARRRRRLRGPEVAREPDVSPWRAALAALEGVERDLAADPGATADAVAHTLRCYVTARYRRDVAAFTTPELAAMPPPPEATAHWRELIALLCALDDARFLPGSAQGPERARLSRDVAARARAYVAATTPPGARG